MTMQSISNLEIIFFQFGCFFARNPNMLFGSENNSPKIFRYSLQTRAPKKFSLSFHVENYIQYACIFPAFSILMFLEFILKLNRFRSTLEKKLFPNQRSTAWAFTRPFTFRRKMNPEAIWPVCRLCPRK